MSAVEPAISTINNAPSLDSDADALRNELKSLLERVRDVNAVAGSGQDQQVRLKREQLLSNFRTWQAKNEQWVTTGGQKYNLKFSETKPSDSSAK